MRRCRRYGAIVIVVMGLGFSFAAPVDLTMISSLFSDFPIQTENAVMEAVAGFDGKIHLEVWYVFPDTLQNPGTVGQFDECMRRLVIQKYFPASFVEYVLSRYSHLRDTLWEKDALVCGIPPDSVRKLVESYGEELYRKNQKVIDSLGTYNPRVFINGREFAGWGGDYPTLKLVFSRILAGEDTVSSFKYKCYSDIDCFTSVDTLRGRCSYRPKGGVCVYDYAFPVVLYILHSSNPYEVEPVRFFSDLRFWFPRIKFVDVEKGTGRFKELFGYVPASFTTLPVYILSGNAEKDASFPQIAHMVVRSDSYFVFNPIVISEYMENTEEPGRIDVFVAPMCPYSLQFENLFLRDFLSGGKIVGNDSFKEVRLHYVIKKNGKDYFMIHGPEEVEELKRQIVIREFFPDKFWDYLRCRAGNINAYWGGCAVSVGLDTLQVLNLVAEKSDSLIAEDMALMNEYGVSSTPTFIYKNKYRFNSLRNFAQIIGWELKDNFEDGQCYY